MYKIYKYQGRRQPIGAAESGSPGIHRGTSIVLVGFDNEGNTYGHYSTLSQSKTQGVSPKADCLEKGAKGEAIAGKEPRKSLIVSVQCGDADAITASTITSRV